MAGNARGHFVWHELMTTDTRSAAGFYTKTVGWSTKPWDQDPTYITWIAKGKQMGGLMVLPAAAKAAGARPSWLPYIGTEDAEVAVWEAQRLGGKVMKDTESLPSVGKFAVLQDPGGAEFAVLEPAYEGKPRYPVEVGDFSWHELGTTDPEGVLRFYSALFGWQKTDAMDMTPVGKYQMFGWKGRSLGGIYRKPAKASAPPHWVSYIKVPDAKKVAEVAKGLGAQIVDGPMEVPGGLVAVAIDPQGAVFAVHSITKKAARTPAAKKTRKVVKRGGKRR